MKNSFFNDKPAHYLEISRREDLRGFSDKFFQSSSSIPVSQALVSSTPQINTLRGLHTQLGNYAEEKIIYCISGELIWFALDYSKYCTAGTVDSNELSLVSGQAIYVPKHHLNGMLSLSDDVTVLILASRPYDQKAGVNVSPFDDVFFGERLNAFDVDLDRFDQKSDAISQKKFLETLVSADN